MRSRYILPFLILLFFALACGRFQIGGGRPTSTPPSPSPTPQVVKVFDVPAIYGKSVEEVKKTVTGGKITYESKENINYEFPQGNLSIDTRASTSKTLYFYLKDNFSGKFYDFVADSPQQVANFAGIDLSGKTRSSSEAMVTYEDRFNGVPVEIVFTRREPGKDKFDSLTVSLKRKP